MRQIHIVCGPPASGKSTYGRRLAERLGAVFLDSDEVCDRLVSAGLQLAGLPPGDRDSADYKSAYREPVYETLFDLAVEISRVSPVVIAGPFTAESQDEDWPSQLRRRFGQRVEISFLKIPEEQRRAQMIERAADRDQSKLMNWSQHQTTAFTGPPPFACTIISPPEGD